MAALDGLCVAVLGTPEVALKAIELTFASPELIRERAPKVVRAGETLDFTTLTPVAGGLFDYKVFGPATVIDAPTLADDA